MSGFFVIATILLIYLVIFQIAKASEYVGVLKGEEVMRKQSNRINGFLLISFLVLGLVGIWYCNDLYAGKTLFAQGSASVEGEKIDTMFMWTLAITGAVFFLTQILLFWFLFKYQEKEGQKAVHFAHSNKLELIWTAVPAIAMTVLVVIGLRNWFHFTKEAPADSIVVEVTGKQFNWIYRYPGKDKVLGKTYFKNISDKNNNPLGQVWDDKANNDDIIETSEMHIPVGVPIKLVINSRDVVHDVGLNHFRMKMDAVPGIPTTMWFTPKYTTKQMQERLNDPEFVYEISCDQMCGPNHFAMRGVIVVEDMNEYKIWLATKKPNYWTAFPDKNPLIPAPAAADTAAAKTTTAKLEGEKK
jgi:cytochrome c oxidase subunit II